MASVQNGEHKHEIREESEMTKTASSGNKLDDFVSIHVSPVEMAIVHQHRHERRLLDFLRAHPSRDWFHKFGFSGRLSPFAFLRRATSKRNSTPLPPGLDSSGERRRFHVPFVRKINWPAVIKHCKNWVRHPMNIALLVWLFFVAAGIVVLGLLMIGLLNDAIPKSSQRKRWTEITNQILNALFTIMCLYQHPRLFHHLVLLCTWESNDKAELRKVYCKRGARQPHERIHMAIVVFFLHITCLSQYVLCALYWGFTSKTRPDWVENLCIGVGIVAPVIAGVYTVYSPLGRKYEPRTDEESQHQQLAMVSNPNEEIVKLGSRRVVVTNPQWVGGLFDCWDDMTVAYLSFFCTICVFGWNMERLGFGNMYVHIVTFILLLSAPFWVFNIAALNIGDSTAKYVVGISGIVLCFFGLLYGGFWRTQMRKRFKLPANPFCFGYASMTDFMQWLLCWSCSLAQEVRTGNFYDIEEDSFCRKGIITEEGSSTLELAPLPREGVSGPLSSASSLTYKSNSSSTSSPVDGLCVSSSSSSPTAGRKDEALTAPLQPLIELEDAKELSNH